MVEFNELQAIEVCLSHGVLNANRKLESHNRRGYLDNKASVESLITDLLTIFDSCELKQNEKGKVIGGKKRTYIVGNLRPVAIKKEDKRVNNGSEVSSHVPLVAMKVLNYFEGNPTKFLEDMNNKKQYVITNSRLARELGLLDVETISHSMILELIGTNIEGVSFKYPQNITLDIHSFIRDRNRNLMNSCLSYLSRENYIHRSFRFMLYDERGGNEVSEELFQSLTVHQQVIVGNYNESSNTNFKIQSIGKIRAKPENLRQKHEKEFLAYMDRNFRGTLTKANVVELIKHSQPLGIEAYRTAYTDSLLTNALRDFNNGFESSIKEESNEKKFFNFIFICLLEKMKYPVPTWTQEYKVQFQRFMGFGKPKVENNIKAPQEDNQEESLDFF